MTYASLLALTALFELPAAASLSESADRGRVVLCALLLNMFTHPVAWIACVDLQLPFAAVEGAVIAVEAVGYCLVGALSWRRAAAVALLANGATIGLSFGL